MNQTSMWELERKLRQGGHTGAMVALYLSPDDAQRLVVDHPNATPAEEMHLTLCYLGEASELEVGREELTAVLRGFALSHKPVEIKTTGTGRFFGVGDNAEDAFYAVIEADGLQSFREELLKAVEGLGVTSVNSRDFTPHITLSYVPHDEQAPDVTLPTDIISLRYITIKWGDSREDFALGPEPRGERGALNNLTFMRAIPDFTKSRIDELLSNPQIPVPIIASTAGMKRDGMDLKSDEWDFGRYRNYPIVLFGHDYAGRMGLPIGLGSNVRVEGDAVKMNIDYDPDDEFAQKCRAKTIKGMLGFSVSWDRVGNKNELIEVSNVNVGLDPAALPDIQRAALRDFFGGDEAYRSLIDLIREDAQPAPEEEKPVEEITLEVEEGEPLSIENNIGRNLLDEEKVDSITIEHGRINAIVERDGRKFRVVTKVISPAPSVDGGERSLSLIAITDKVWRLAMDQNWYYVEDVLMENGVIYAILCRSDDLYRQDVEVTTDDEVVFVGQPILVKKVYVPVGGNGDDGRAESNVNSRDADEPDEETVLVNPESEPADADILAQLFDILKIKEV